LLRERYLHELDVRELREERLDGLARGIPALLVLDMQDFFLSPESHAFIPSAPDLVPLLRKMADTFESAGLPVIYTRHINTEENAGMMGRWWRDMITAENPLSRIHKGLGTASPVIGKTQYDAFHGTELHRMLSETGVTSVIVTGVVTHLCCETTARAAFVRGYEVLMPVDCTATLNRDIHTASMLSLSHGFTRPSCGEAVIRSIRNAR